MRANIVYCARGHQYQLRPRDHPRAARAFVGGLGGCVIGFLRKRRHDDAARHAGSNRSPPPTPCARNAVRASPADVPQGRHRRAECVAETANLALYQYPTRSRRAAGRRRLRLPVTLPDAAGTLPASDSARAPSLLRTARRSVQQRRPGPHEQLGTCRMQGRRVYVSSRGRSECDRGGALRTSRAAATDTEPLVAEGTTPRAWPAARRPSNDCYRRDFCAIDLQALLPKSPVAGDLDARAGHRGGATVDADDPPGAHCCRPASSRPARPRTATSTVPPHR